MSPSSICRDLWRELEVRRKIEVNGVLLSRTDEFAIVVWVTTHEDLNKLPLWFQDYSITGQVGEPGEHDE